MNLPMYVEVSPIFEGFQTVGQQFVFSGANYGYELSETVYSVAIAARHLEMATEKLNHALKTGDISDIAFYARKVESYASGIKYHSENLLILRDCAVEI